MLQAYSQLRTCSNLVYKILSLDPGNKVKVILAKFQMFLLPIKI